MKKKREGRPKLDTVQVAVRVPRVVAERLAAEAARRFVMTANQAAAAILVEYFRGKEA